MLEQVKNTTVAFTKSVGDVVVEIVKKPALPVFIGTWYACKKYTTLGGFATFVTSLIAAETAKFVAAKTCEYLEEMEAEKAFTSASTSRYKASNTDELIENAKVRQQAEQDALLNMKDSTFEVIKYMTSPLTMEEQYEAAIDAALLNK